MNSNVLLSALSVQAAFGLYMLAAGLGPWRALKIVGAGIAVAALGAALVMLVIPILLVGERAATFTHLASLLSILVAPVFASHFARDELLPRISALELILLNVVALYFAAATPGLRWLLNPLSALVPPSELGRWLYLAVALWPTWLALVLIRQHENTDLRLRLVLVLWAVLGYVLLLIGPAIHAVTAFDASSPGAWFDSLIAGFVAVRVALLLSALFELTFRRDQYMAHESGAAYGDAANLLASRVYTTAMPPWMAFLVGLGFWLLLRFAATQVRVDLFTLQALALGAVFVLAALFMPYGARESAPARMPRPRLNITLVRRKIVFVVVAILAYGLVTVERWSREYAEKHSILSAEPDEFRKWLTIVPSVYLALFAVSTVTLLVDIVRGRPVARNVKWAAWVIAALLTYGFWQVRLSTAQA